VTEPHGLPAVRVLLVGMMGSGKSTVGRALSSLTGWPYVDNDELVLRAQGMPTDDVLERGGVAALRSAERAALRAAVETPPPAVLGVAGGVVDDPVDRKLLASGGYVVWLRARLDTLAKRVGSGAGRPWLQANPVAALERLYAGRAAHYAEVATQVVDVDDASPDEIAATILDGVEQRPG
jgi:shikimate kinase